MNNSIFYTDEMKGLSPQGTVPEIEEEEMNKYTIGLILGILSAGLVEQGLSPQAAAHPPFQYGGVPTLTYEYNLQGPTTIESESIKTSGTIKSIAAYYEFEGQVRLEVSANGGNAYTKIINGAILTDGFIPGNELRFRATIADNSVLKKIIIGYTDSSGASTLYQNPDLKNYKYRKAIYISGGSEEVFNYPVQVKGLSPQEAEHPPIRYGGVPTSPEVYFTSADGQTPLYYYLEKEIATSPVAPRNDVIATPNEVRGKQSRIFWVKVPQIPTQGTMIYVYYNNVFASSPAAPRNDKFGVIASPQGAKQSQYNDPTKVFLFFDDFSATILDEAKWEVTAGLKKEYNLKDSNLQLKDCMVISRNFKIKQGVLEFKAKAESNCSIQAIVRGRNAPRSLFPFEQSVYSSNYPGAEHTIAINDMAKLNIGKPIEPLTYYIYKVTLNQSGIIFERYSENYQKQAQIQFLDMGNLDEGYIGLKADAAPFNAGSVYFDWVRVRPYLDVEPTVTSLLENESVAKGD